MVLNGIGWYWMVLIEWIGLVGEWYGVAVRWNDWKYGTNIYKYCEDPDKPFYSRVYNEL